MSRLSGDALVEDRLAELHDALVLSQGGGVHVPNRRLLVDEVPVPVLAAHQHRRVAITVDLPHVRRDVADRDTDPAVIAEFALYLEIAAWGYAGFGLLIVGNGIMNAVDKASFALLQSVARVFLVMLPVALVMQPQAGSAAIYTAELAANLFGAVSAVVLVRQIFIRRQPAWQPR